MAIFPANIEAASIAHTVRPVAGRTRRQEIVMISGGIEIKMPRGTMTFLSMIVGGMEADIAMRFLEALVVMAGLVMRITTGLALVVAVLIVDFLEVARVLHMIMRNRLRTLEDIGKPVLQRVKRVR